MLVNIMYKIAKMRLIVAFGLTIAEVASLNKWRHQEQNLNEFVYISAKATADAPSKNLSALHTILLTRRHILSPG